MTDERLRMIFGFCLLMALFVLAACIALGKVHQESSFGLEGIISALTLLVGQFAQWAFSVKKDK